MSSNDPLPGGGDVVARPTRRPGVAFWLGLAVLLIGVVVAVLGVRAAAASYERGKDLEHYAAASTQAQQAASVGGVAASTGTELLALDRSTAAAAPELRRLLVDGSEEDYTSRARTLNSDNVRKAELRSQIVALANELGRAPGEGATPTPSATPGAPVTMAPPVTIAPWPDVSIRTVCLDVTGTFEDRPITAEQVEEAGALARRLEYRGLTVAAAGMPCDARLTLRFDGTAQSADYDQTSSDPLLLIPVRLYTGARITGTLALTVPGRPPVSVDQSLKSAADEHVTDSMTQDMKQPIDALVHIRLWLDEGLTKLGLPEL